MTKIRIEELSDDIDCETCGCSWATGYKVYMDGELKINLEPFASCYDSTSYTQEDLMWNILKEFGHEVEFE